MDSWTDCSSQDFGVYIGQKILKTFYTMCKCRQATLLMWRYQRSKNSLRPWTNQTENGKPLPCLVRLVSALSPDFCSANVRGLFVCQENPSANQGNVSFESISREVYDLIWCHAESNQYLTFGVFILHRSSWRFSACLSNFLPKNTVEWTPLPPLQTEILKQI